MEDTLTLKRSRTVQHSDGRKKFSSTDIDREKMTAGKFIDVLTAEGGEHFSPYLYFQGLNRDHKILALYSNHHYYYDQSELEKVNTVVNLKKLNLINQLNSFLFSMNNVLPPGTNFVGYFSDWKTQKNVRLTSRMYKSFINILDHRTDIEIDRNEVSKLLESNGFKIINMTRNNGLTYFRSQTDKRTVN